MDVGPGFGHGPELFDRPPPISLDSVTAHDEHPERNGTDRPVPIRELHPILIGPAWCRAGRQKTFSMGSLHIVSGVALQSTSRTPPDSTCRSANQTSSPRGLRTWRSRSAGPLHSSWNEMSPVPARKYRFSWSWRSRRATRLTNNRQISVTPIRCHVRRHAPPQRGRPLGASKRRALNTGIILACDSKSIVAFEDRPLF